MRIALEHFLHGALELLGIALGDIGQCVQEHELRHDFRQRIGLHHFGISCMHGSIVVAQIGSVGLVVELFLHEVHALEVLDVVGVLHCLAILGVGKVVKNELPIPLRVGYVATAVVKQIHIIISVETVGVVGVAFKQLLKLIGCRWQVVELVFKNHAHVVESFLYHIVRCLDFLFGLGNLFQVVLLVVWVVGSFGSFLVHFSGVVACGLCGVVALGVFFFLFFVLIEREGVLVAPAPVILELAVTPLLLECGFTGILGGGVVEVPRVVVVDIIGGRLLGVVFQSSALALLLSHISLALGILFLFFFFLLEVLDNLGDNLLLLLERQLRQPQQRVLQSHVARVHRQLIEHVAALLELLVVGVILAKLRNGLAVAWLCLVILVLSKVDASQGELADGFVNAVACAFLGCQLIVLDGVGGVATCEVEVANGIVNLVEVFLVAVVACHALEGFYLAVDIAALEHGTLLDAGIELSAVGRTAAASCTLVGLVGFLFLPYLVIELSQEEVQANLLSTAAAVDGFLKERHGLSIHFTLDIIVGKGKVGKLLQPLVLNLAGVYVGKHVVGLGGPVHSAVTQGLPNLGFEHQVGFPREVSSNVVESGRRAQEVAFHVLRLSHEVPCIVDEWVILLALEPFLVLRVIALARFALGFFLYGVQRDGLLHLLDGAVKVGGGLCGLGIVIGLGGMNKELCRVVVLILVFQLLDLLAIVLLAVVVHIVAGVHRMPKTATGSVLLGAARREDRCRYEY